MNLFQFLYNKIKWKFVAKRKGEQLIRSNLHQMLKKDAMSQMGGRLRMNQTLGKLKHQAKNMHRVK